MTLNAKYLAGTFNAFPPINQNHGIAPFQIGQRLFNWGSDPLIMGVINLSPDSWYRESVSLNAESAISRGKVLLAQGADVLDVGAESSLNSADRVAAEKQLDRVLPVIQGLVNHGAVISLETYRAPVAKAGGNAGANVINLTGYQDQEEIFEYAASNDLTLILCFVDGSNVREVDQIRLNLRDPVSGLKMFFENKIDLALKYGARKLALDPGLGFYYRNLLDSKTRVQYQMRAFLQSYRLHELGFPVCNALPHAFEYFGEEVRVAEPYFASLAGIGGTHWFRTHEVAKVRPIVELMTDFDSD